MLKARLLRFFALIFALAGVLTFLILYMQNVEGTFLSSLQNPFIITIIVVPFLPAAVLSYMAARIERIYAGKTGRG